MLKLIALSLFVVTSVYAKDCIRLQDYQLANGNGYAESELADFNQKKFKIYRSFILNSNKISQYFTAETANLYDIGLSDTDLSTQISNLSSQKAAKINENCRLHKNQLLKLIKSF